MSGFEELCTRNNEKIDLIYLYNFYDYIDLPSPSIYSVLGSGVNISSTKLTEEVIRNCHLNNKKVGVWIDRSLFNEDDAFYFSLMDLGVDFFCTDFPLLMKEARTEWLRLNKESYSTS